MPFSKTRCLTRHQTDFLSVEFDHRNSGSQHQFCSLIVLSVLTAPDYHSSNPLNGLFRQYSGAHTAARAFLQDSVFLWISEFRPHFSNKPPPSDTPSVSVTEELQSPAETVPDSEAESAKVEIPQPTESDNLRSDTALGGNTENRNEAEILISKERQNLEEKLEPLYERLNIAGKARSKDSSYDNQERSEQIEQLKSKIDAEIRNYDDRIQLIKSQFGVE